MKNSSLRVIALVWAAVMIAVLSSTATLLISGHANPSRDDDTHWVSQEEYDSVQRYRRLDEVRSILLNKYYKELDEEALLLGAIRGMTGSVGDPYTFYFTPEELKRNNEDNAGNYKGVGILLQNDEQGQIEVIQVYPGSPAEAAGVREGDMIVAVDGTKVSGADGRAYNDAIARIRGGDGTLVTLRVLRNGQTLDITVKRGDVAVDYAEYQLIAGNIGYIRISQFTGNAMEICLQAIESFRSRGVAGLVIDLRNNPGGYLDQVVSVADKLLPKGLIVYVEERDGTRQDYYSDEEFLDVPLAVLVNEKSASASEILALAVQALGRGTVVGTNTYGKGIVQSLKSFKEDDAGIQLTTSSYFDALDRCPQGVGVKPDVEVALEGERVPLEPDLMSDNQLAAAIEEVRRQADDQ